MTHHIVALLNAQGTACAETALLGTEDTPENRAKIEASINSHESDPPILGTWTNCSANEALWPEEGRLS